MLSGQRNVRRIGFCEKKGRREFLKGRFQEVKNQGDDTILKSRDECRTGCQVRFEEWLDHWMRKWDTALAEGYGPLSQHPNHLFSAGRRCYARETRVGRRQFPVPVPARLNV